ncbi:hypothetical protein QAD02_017187 [Eretmocerus hayati]|uniref:Uncharacterized protein n=1 Tax=Eretmocerus hayati TaxID=131215 RepID=A0ACC2PCQ5_9HYME|nr:hypothetical protein QAD02_017187 [Eretmocerus hayati]
MHSLQSLWNYFGIFLEIIGLASNDPTILPLPGLLFPRESESREVRSLDGLWDFLVPPKENLRKGIMDEWYNDDLSKAGEVRQMPVPSSYNDVTTSSELRDHVGPVWYEKSFYIPASWSTKRIFLRFGSVNYYAQVWLNGRFLMQHEMGHLPFESEITLNAFCGKKNRVTVAVDNRLSQISIPQGNIVELQTDNGTSKMQSYTFDFFNYAGIHRPVLLHSKPKVFIEDLTIKTDIKNNTGIVNYKIEVTGLAQNESYSYDVNLVDANNERISRGFSLGKQGILRVANPKLWWPQHFQDQTGYLYELEVILSVANTGLIDIYRLPIGIRSLKWNESSVLVNDKPIYFRGFGKHEDAAIRGRGLDLPTLARDYELLQWSGANAYRTSHYPYSDEALDLADRLGILVIDECPAVDTDNYSPILLMKHKQSMSELIRRDKNRPSVIMWSVANEPRTSQFDAGKHFKYVTGHTRQLDSTRPITMAIATSSKDDHAGRYIDVISFNRYNAWYSNPGRTDMITKKIVSEVEDWHRKYNKPIIMSEYGADTISGLHELPSYVWSEEYQLEIISKHFEAFDDLRLRGFFIGEFVWNFADFRTAQGYTRVGGNKKGVFTRDRQPKSVAHHVRKRYLSMMEAELEQKISPQAANYSLERSFDTS